MAPKHTDNCFLIEDHHEALSIWRNKKVKNLDLIHIDAHIDFNFYAAKPLRQAAEEARTLKGLKQALERSLAFSRFEKDFDKQTTIGNYIYPAIRKGIVRNFYWVIPGRTREFKESRKQLKIMLKNLLRQDPLSAKHEIMEHKNSFSVPLMGRRLVITTIENLPVFKDKVFLDIDTDFLAVDKLENARASSMIGRRKPWISPKSLAQILKAKIKNPFVTTIAYSVNGGFTPLKFKHLGDEVAFYLFPEKRKNRYQDSVRAADNFSKFLLSKKAHFYRRAIKLNPTYRVSDNNYGNLYLAKRSLSRAEKEFEGIAKIDLRNPRPLIGLGRVALLKKDYRRARNFFARALSKAKHDSEATQGLAEAEFRLDNEKKAQKLFLEARKKDSCNPVNYYFLGRIAYKKHDFESAVRFYKNAIILGLDGIDVYKRLLRIAKKVKDREGIVKLPALKLKRLNAALEFFKRKKDKSNDLTLVKKRIEANISQLKNLLAAIYT